VSDTPKDYDLVVLGMQDVVIRAARQMIADPEPVAPTALLVARPEPFPISTREIGQRADELIKAGTVPDTLRHADRKTMRSRIVQIIRTGADVGMPPSTALSKIILLDNRPCILCAGALALAQRSGLVQRVERAVNGIVIDDDGDGDSVELLREFKDQVTADYRIWRRGQHEPYVGRYSVRDARRARLWNNPRRPWWIAAPGQMLLVRATSIALHAGFEDVMGGLSIVEEVRDIAAPTITPPGETTADFLADA
jgi:Ni/Co efflux regulator RcnB